MIHRVTLVAGAFVATAIMSFAAGLQNTPPAPAAAATDEVVAAAPVAAAAPIPTPEPVASPAAETVTDTVYVLPTPEPAVVHVTRQAPPTVIKAKRPPASPTATRAPRQRSGDDGREGEHEGESEGGDD